MSPYAKIGATIVLFALLCYSVAIVTEQRQARITDRVLWFLTIGVGLDVTATAFMILGSSQGPFTLHGLLGYSSLAGMLTDCVLIWRHRTRCGHEQPVPDSLHRYSLLAYVWWILAFITGGMLVALRHA